MVFSLQDRITLVTGGGSGIGYCFVRRALGAGCRILVADLALHNDMTQWIASLDEADQARIVFQATDVTDWAQLDRAFTVCIERFGGPPSLVLPCAGVFEPNGFSYWRDADTHGDSHYKILDINLTHPLKTTRIAVRHLVNAQQSGAILFVSSIAAQRSSIVTPLYQASKHGVTSFIRGMAPLDELVNIKVAGVAPGTVATPLYTEHASAQKFLDSEKDYLLPPDAVVDALFALLEDKYKSGTILEVCHVTDWREVQLLNDPGPSGPASTTSRKHEALAEIMQYLQPSGAPAKEFKLVKTD